MPAMLGLAGSLQRHAETRPSLQSFSRLNFTSRRDLGLAAPVFRALQAGGVTPESFAEESEERKLELIEAALKSSLSAQGAAIAKQTELWATSEPEPLAAVDAAPSQEELRALGAELFRSNTSIFVKKEDAAAEDYAFDFGEVHRSKDHPSFPYYEAEVSVRSGGKTAVQPFYFRTDGRRAFISSSWALFQRHNVKGFIGVSRDQNGSLSTFDQTAHVLETLPDQVILSRSMSKEEDFLWKKGLIQKIETENQNHSGYSEKAAPRTAFALNYYAFNSRAPQLYAFDKKTLLELHHRGLLIVNTYEDLGNSPTLGMAPIARTPFGLEVEVVVLGLEGRRAILPSMRRPLEAAPPAKRGRADDALPTLAELKRAGGQGYILRMDSLGEAVLVTRLPERAPSAHFSESIFQESGLPGILHGLEGLGVGVLFGEFPTVHGLLPQSPMSVELRKRFKELERYHNGFILVDVRKRDALDDLLHEQRHAFDRLHYFPLFKWSMKEKGLYEALTAEQSLAAWTYITEQRAYWDSYRRHLREGNILLSQEDLKMVLDYRTRLERAVAGVPKKVRSELAGVLSNYARHSPNRIAEFEPPTLAD